MCQGRKQRLKGNGHLIWKMTGILIHSWYIKPLRNWVDDHPLLWSEIRTVNDLRCKSLLGFVNDYLASRPSCLGANTILSWNSKQPVFNGCFNWMILNHYMKNWCFTKHPLKTGCLGFQALICQGTLGCTSNSVPMVFSWCSLYKDS